MVGQGGCGGGHGGTEARVLVGRVDCGGLRLSWMEVTLGRIWLRG